MPEEQDEQRPAGRRLRRLVAPGVDEVTAPDETSYGQPPSDPAEAVVPGPSVREPGDRPARLPGPHPFDPGRRGVRALAAVAVVVVVLAAFLAWRARPRPEPVPMAEVSVPARATLEGDPPGSAAPAASAPAAEVVVSVAGKVRRPGLVRLPAGARVADAIDAAGGVLPGADVAFLNLARRVTDGELILVGVTAPPGAPGPAPGGPGAPGGAGPGAGGPGGAAPVNLNTATLAELDALPGVGPVLAQRIIDHRERHGAFRAVSDLRQVDGIGEARYEELKGLVAV